MDRRQFLRLATSGVGAGALGACTSVAPRTSVQAPGRAGQPWLLDGRRPNILVLLTDQQRALQHFPPDFADRYLPSLRRLEARGISFRRAFTSAAQCTPARGALLTGTYPWVNGVTKTFIGSPTFDGAPLQSAQMNLARLLAGAGYAVAYKGKWHLSDSISGGPWTEGDVQNLAQRYGLPRWNPPDAGTSLTKVSTAGGGVPDNDGRFVAGVTPGAQGQTPGWGGSVLDELEARAGDDRPFCLFASLVNPHDIGFFPARHRQAGYRPEQWAGFDVGLPPNARDTLETKPSIQAAFRALFDEFAPLPSDALRAEYIAFYAYLHTLADSHIARILDALDALKLTDRTIVFRLADHGEQAIAHGMIEKMYQCYEETVRVPLIVSNPVLFPKAVTTDSLASLVDLFPTIAALAGVDPAALVTAGVVGHDLRPILNGRSASVQEAVLFTYDDQYGVASPGVVVEGKPAPYLPGALPSHIRARRERSWKYAVYFTPDGAALQYELYNLDDDPQELRNLAFEPPGGHGTVDAERQRLHRALTDDLVRTGTLPLGFRWPKESGVTSARL